MRVSEIRVKWIRVNQGLGVYTVAACLIKIQGTSSPITFKCENKALKYNNVESQHTWQAVEFQKNLYWSFQSLWKVCKVRIVIKYLSGTKFLTKWNTKQKQYSQLNLIWNLINRLRSIYKLRKGVLGLFRKPPTHLLKTFSLHKVRENCHLLDHLPTAMPLHNIKMVP